MSQPLAQPPLSFSSLQSAQANTSYVNANLSADGAPSKNAGELKLPPKDTSNGSCSSNVPNLFSIQIPYSNPPSPPLYSQVPPGMQMPTQMPFIMPFKIVFGAIVFVSTVFVFFCVWRNNIWLFGVKSPDH